MKSLKTLTAILMVLFPLAISGQWRASLLTFWPGDEVYELDGHTALRLRNDTLGVDATFNWGTFDFNTPNFVYRFVKGETDYMVAEVPTELFVRSYAVSGRRVVEQELSLNEAQTERLVGLVLNNMTPENRVYRYNYVKDNCATRPLALIERAVGRGLYFDMEKTGESYRDIMRMDHKNYPWYQFGIDLALGSGIDSPMSVKERSFAPLLLRDMFNHAFYRGKPLVKEERVLAEGSEEGTVLGPTPWYLTPMTVMTIVALAMIIVTIRDYRRGRPTRIADSLWYGVIGIVGLILTFLVFVSVHEATTMNALYLWLNPTGFIIAVGVWIKRMYKVVVSMQILNFALILAVSALGIFGYQSYNIALWPLICASLLRTIVDIELYKGDTEPS